MSMALQHNGANTNLYCDGAIVFVQGCPACDVDYEAKMKPRRKRAQALAGELRALGMVIQGIRTDLYWIEIEATFGDHSLVIKEH